MKKKLMIILPVLLLVLGGAYKFVLAKPKEAEAKPKVDGTVYVLQKEFLVNLADGRFAKLTVALVLAHDDTSTAAAGGHEAAVAAGGLRHDAAGGRRARHRHRRPDRCEGADVIDREGREQLKKKILKELKKKTDVKVEEVLFTDVTVQ